MTEQPKNFGFGEDETALVDVIAEVILLLARQLKGVLSAQEQDGRLHQVFQRGGPRINCLPRQIAFPLPFDMSRQVMNSVTM